MESEDYDLLAYEAQRIVDQVVAQSLLHLREANLSENIGNVRGRFLESENQPWQDKSAVQWPTIGEFDSEEVGIEKIHEYIEKVIVHLRSSPIEIFVGMENHTRWSRYLLALRH